MKGSLKLVLPRRALRRKRHTHKLITPTPHKGASSHWVALRHASVKRVAIFAGKAFDFNKPWYLMQLSILYREQCHHIMYLYFEKVLYAMQHYLFYLKFIKSETYLQISTYNKRRIEVFNNTDTTDLATGLSALYTITQNKQTLFYFYSLHSDNSRHNNILRKLRNTHRYTEVCFNFLFNFMRTDNMRLYLGLVALRHTLSRTLNFKLDKKYKRGQCLYYKNTKIYNIVTPKYKGNNQYTKRLVRYKYYPLNDIILKWTYVLHAKFIELKAFKLLNTSEPCIMSPSVIPEFSKRYYGHYRNMAIELSKYINIVKIPRNIYNFTYNLQKYNYLWSFIFYDNIVSNDSEYLANVCLINNRIIEMQTIFRNKYKIPTLNIINFFYFWNCIIYDINLQQQTMLYLKHNNLIFTELILLREILQLLLLKLTMYS